MGNRAVAQLLRGPVVVQRDLADTLHGKLDAAEALDAPAIEEIFSAVKGADEPQRRTAFTDTVLDAKARAKLGETVYPRFLHALGIHADVSPAQLSSFATPEAAAEAIAGQVLAAFGPELQLDAAGLRKAMVILDTDRFVAAALRYYPKKAPGDFDGVSGFNIDGKVFIDAGKTTDVGTLIHEAIHLFAPDTFGTELGNDLNEGVTEYFARATIAQLGLDITRTKYQSEYLYADAFIAHVGRDVIQRTYFRGDLEALEKALAGREGGAVALKDLATAGKDREELMRFLSDRGLLAGPHRETIQQLRKIEATHTEILELAQPLKSWVASWKLQTSTRLSGPAYRQANDVYTGRAAHDLGPVVTAIGAQRDLVERARKGFLSLCTLDPERGRAQGEALQKLADQRPDGLGQAELAGYCTALEEVLEKAEKTASTAAPEEESLFLPF